MTPLPWWVFLALPLVVVDAHLDEYACVCFCRARNGSPKIAEACDHAEYHVLGSHGGAYLLQRLFKLCLIPHSDPKSPHHPLFYDWENCRFIRDDLIQRHGCSCDTLNNGKSAKPEEEKQRFVYAVAVPFIDAEDGASEAGASEGEGFGVGASEDEDQQGWRSTDLSEEELKIPVVDNHLNAIDADTSNASEDETDSREDPIDWHPWCMAHCQCDNGQGGSARHCDIIP